MFQDLWPCSHTIPKTRILKGKLKREQAYVECHMVTEGRVKDK